MSHSSRIQNAGLANHALVGESCDLLHVVRHEVQGLVTTMTTASGAWSRMPAPTWLMMSRSSDEILTGHPRLAREARRDDHHVRAGDVFVGCGAGDASVVVEHGSVL